MVQPVEQLMWHTPLMITGTANKQKKRSTKQKHTLIQEYPQLT
jgi:hypothetical protein